MHGNKYEYIYDSGIALGALVTILWLYFGLLGGRKFFLTSLGVLTIYFSIAITLKMRGRFGAAAFVAWLPGICIFVLWLATSLRPLYLSCLRLFTNT